MRISTMKLLVVILVLVISSSCTSATQQIEVTETPFTKFVSPILTQEPPKSSPTDQITALSPPVDTESVAIIPKSDNLEAYPPPDEEIAPYPLPTSTDIETYPYPDENEGMQSGTPFRFDKPIFEGSNEINGSGPPDVPIIILNITFMGEFIGEGTINPDGYFSINVPTLNSGHRIGIILGNLSGTKWKKEDFNAGFYGDEAVLVPTVGFFYDTALIQEQ